jgi:hypothetical protein
MNSLKRKVLYAGTSCDSDSETEPVSSSLELFKSSKGFDSGLKYLVSENFKNFDNQNRPEFGIPTIHFDDSTE